MYNIQTGEKMENAEYNRLIYNNKLDELASICNTGDLTRYKYIKKYLLEYLLEQKIHKRIMDSYAINHPLWIRLYIQYDILEPLLNAPINKLLVEEKKEILLITLLNKLDNEQKLRLFNNLKKNSYWLLRNYETQIINIYANYGITIKPTFVKMPIISDKNLEIPDELQYLIIEFTKTFKDIDKNILKLYINEFIKKHKINKYRTYLDINKLIYFKKKYRSFKLDVYNSNNGEYNSNENKIVINWYRYGTLNHELSHMLYDTYEFQENNRQSKEYWKIHKKINNSRVILNIIKYLKDFHQRYEDMDKLFQELYYAELNKTYGSYNNYCKKIYEDLKKSEPEFITLDDTGATIYVDDDLKTIVEDLIYDECHRYKSILLQNYYSEELELENLLDAILKGNIYEGKYDITCLSGHSKEYFNTEKNISFDEVLANYDGILNSSRANRLIKKLREIVGDELVDFLNNYIDKNRNYHKKPLQKKR